jgi:DNA polymerase III alpha subunit
VSTTEQTPEAAVSSDAQERIRKIFVKDLKSHEGLHSVFRAAKKERLTSRSGTPYLAVTLVDRTGEVDARVFENVDSAEKAFAANDYLLIKGKVGHFHGKPQVVVERLERLDPEPIDPKEFAWVPVPKEVKEPREPKEQNKEAEGGHKATRQRLLNDLTQAIDALIRFYADEKGERKSESKPPRPEKKPRGPKIEHKTEAKADGPKPLPRDPNLPEGLAFKPFTELVEP